MTSKFTSLKHPVQNYPYRQPMDIVKPLIPYITNKSVCDIGCGCGDVLFELGKHASEIFGIEFNMEFKNQLEKIGVDRSFIKWGDVFETEIPKSDVYYIWISSDVSLNRRIIDLLPKDSLVIDATARLELFSEFKDLKLIEKIEYKFSEESLIGSAPAVVGGVSFDTIGTNIVRIYKKI